MGAFVNSDATFPGGPGGKRYRREEMTRRTRIARTPARDDATGVLLNTSIMITGFGATIGDL